ncbi:DUF349 domain-containing protein [Reichenbachiella versicolor]|uniref:DUF349 domain-containing protein n=1 Tax=Reichenbachiella versicolor TaxID=1821036 RepID=UPI000D6E42B5|nr:DUF349 domain-containing protein [Reichenbachiella versicolor]
MGIPYGYIEDKVLYRAAFGDIEALKLMEVAEDEVGKHVAHFEANFKKLSDKLEDVINKINSSNNKGSFYSSLMNIKDSIRSHKGIGDYQTMLDKIGQYESMLTDFIQKNREKNTDIKQALLLEMDEVLKNNDIQEAFDQIKDLKQRWVKTGSPVLTLAEELELKYKTKMDAFFDKRKSFMEAKQMLNTAREEDYQSIIDKIQEFIDQKSFGKTQQQVKELQKKWKEAGRIPEEQFKKLNDTYWSVTKEYFEKVKQFRSEEKKSRVKSEKQSIEGRKDIISTLEELLDKSSLVNVKKELDEIAVQWKKAGHMSKGAYKELQDNYYKTLKTIQEKQFILNLTQRKNKGFESLKEEDKIGLLTKTIRNVLRRDEDELASFTDNMDKMTINKGSFVDMLEGKLEGLKEKVALKRELLKEYKSKINK